MNPIVGIGELLWDIYPDGRSIAGGAPFNFAFHCHQLGHTAAIVSRVGDDDLGRELREQVRELGLSDEYIQTDLEHPTGTVRVTVDGSAVPSYTITENVAWDHIAWDEPTGRLLYPSPAVCFGTLAQRGTVSRESIDRFRWNVFGFHGRHRPLEPLPWADNPDHEPGIVVFDINLRAPFYSREIVAESFRNSTWIKLNEEEYAILAGMFGFQHMNRIALDEITRLGPIAAETVILTRGCGGSLVRQLRLVEVGDDWQDEIEFADEPGVPASVVDSVGAGDAFTAAMACLHLEGRPLRECARFANHYAARVCEHQGATPRIDRSDVERAAGLLP